jgi:(p)ppGpp synthase/HD superfamily hydrolase
MLAYKLYKPKAFDHEHFSLLLNGVFSANRHRKTIQNAYQLSECGHRAILRSRERYFERPKAVALILLQQQVEDMALIAAALLQGLAEDGRFLTFDDLERLFGERTRHAVELVTVTHGVSKQDYFQRLAQVSGQPAAWAVKCAGTLYDLSTLDGSTAQEKLEQVGETRMYVLPLAESRKEVPYYSAMAEYFIWQLKLWCAIRDIQALETSALVDN